jgi:hypothetical protein
MKSIGLLAVALFLTSCQLVPHESPAMLRGRLVLEVVPNPIPAVLLGDDLYELTFDIIMREEGGVAVTIEEFTVDAIAFRTVAVQSQTFPATFITDRGYPASIEAGKYLRFSFTKRWKLPGRLLMSGASARVRARTRDANGRRDEAVVRVGVVVASPPLEDEPQAPRER